MIADRKYPKTNSYTVIEGLVRFNDFTDYVLDNFEYDNLIIPKNLLLLLGMNEVNGYIKNGRFAHFTQSDSFIQHHTAIKLGDVESVYISINGQLNSSKHIIDGLQRGTIGLPVVDRSAYGKICTVSIINFISFTDTEKDRSTTYSYQYDECTVSRLTNYVSRESYYSDDDLSKFYRVLSRQFQDRIQPNVIDELQRELSAMCDFITKQ